MSLGRMLASMHEVQSPALQELGVVGVPIIQVLRRWRQGSEIQRYHWLHSEFKDNIGSGFKPVGCNPFGEGQLTLS